MAMLGAASIRSRIATGPEAGSPWRRLGDRVELVGEEDEGANGVEPVARIPPRCVRESGMSLHADVAVPARDRRRLERLCRYVARPPLALDRLEELRDGRLAYRLKTPWRDGTTHVVMERRELLERLAPLIPPPRSHQVRYHGVLAPCASGRDRIVPGRQIAGEGDSRRDGPMDRSALDTRMSGSAGPFAEEESPLGEFVDGGPIGTAAAPVGSPSVTSQPPRPSQPSLEEPLASEGHDPGSLRTKTKDPRRRTAWADLLQRVFEVDVLCCPRCGGRMRILSAITDPDVARRILEWLDVPSRAPPQGSSADGASPERPRMRGAESATDLAGGEWDDGPGFDFDQSLPGDGVIGGGGG